jgi:hypothetical protein
MRRSGTPSIRLARLTHDERENTPCAGGGPSQAGSLGFSCTHGVSLGGFMGMQTQDMPAAEDAAADRSAAPQHGTAPRPFRSAVSVGQFKVIKWPAAGAGCCCCNAGRGHVICCRHGVAAAGLMRPTLCVAMYG